MNEENLLSLLYASETTAGWHAGMTAVTSALLQRIALPAAPCVLEVGCGGGDVLRLLTRTWPAAQLVGVDLNALAVTAASGAMAAGATAEFGSASAATVAQANLLQLPFATGSFDLLLALDSFDQSGVELAAALAEARRVLAPGGKLLLRVSAYPWLYGAHDRAFNTGRRYTRDEVRQALQQHGFAFVAGTHANALLAPPVVLLRLLAQRDQTNSSVYMSPLANRVVQAALRSEALWLRRAALPVGLSYFAIAQKSRA